jgi:hypothetical protein
LYVEVVFKKKMPPKRQVLFGGIAKKKPLKKGAFGGASWNRTSDTRIFSPLLYRLSYGTVWTANVRRFFNCQKK